MKNPATSSLSFRFSLILFCFIFMTCSEEGAEPQYIPSIGAFWQDGNNGNNMKHSITWQYQPDVSGCPYPIPCSNTGYFTGIDSYRASGTGNSSSCTIAGSFKNHHIEWFYPENSAWNANCPIRGTFYSGTINDSSTVITVNSPTLGDLVLRKR